VKILLVVKSKKMENLGVMYLSSIIKKEKHRCKIVSIDETIGMTRLWKPDVIGFSIMTGDQERFKNLHNQIMNMTVYNKKQPKIIVGGPHPTFFPDDCDWADTIAKGDAEEFIAEYIGASGTYDHIDKYPWPDRTDFRDESFMIRGIRDFISSRGCPYNCAYCYNERWADMFPEHPRVRYRDPDDVVNEIARVQPEWAYFQDSCFGVSMGWLRKFAPRYAASVNIPYHCHLRPSQATEDRVVLLVDSNCQSVRIALETGVQRLRELIKRGKTSNEETLQASKVLRKWNIDLMIQNILGLPTSTIEDDLTTLEVNIRAMPAYAWCSIFQPYPGTELGELCKEKGWYKGDYSEISDSFFDGSVLEFDPEHKEQLVCLQKIFALCVEVGYVPTVKELTIGNFPNLTHKIMRIQGDKRLFRGMNI